MPPPRLITHRPGLLRLTDWAYRDGRPHLAAWLDASEATGPDWHTPALVLIDAQCLSMMSLLYGERRAGTTLVVGLAGEDPAAPRVQRVTGSAARVLRVDRPLELHELVLLLHAHRHPARGAAIPTRRHRPGLHLVRGGNDTLMGQQ